MRNFLHFFDVSRGNTRFLRLFGIRFFSLFILLCFANTQSWGQISEGFESGLPGSYGSLSTVSLSSGSWQVTQVIAGTTGVNSGTKSAQLQSATGSQLISPLLSGGVGTISFYITASTSSGAFQVNISTNGGTSWTAATGSPFTISTTKTLKTIVVNNANVNKIQIYRTGATLYIDDFAASIAPITTYTLTTQAGVGGSVIAPSSTTTIVNSGVSTPITAAANAGYTFSNWTNPTGTAIIANSTSISTTATLSSGNATVMANFTANNNSITFNGNTASSGSMTNQTIATDASANLTNNEYTKIGYTFAGWNTLANGNGINYANQASFTMGSNNVTLYAIWTPLPSSSTDYFRSKTSGNWSDITTWESSSDNTNWISATLAPTSSANAVSILNGHMVTVTEDATSSGITIKAGGQLTVNSTKTLAITGNLTAESNSIATGTIVDNGTLTVTGNTNVQQYLTVGRNWYISSPVTGATSDVFSASTYWYDEAHGTSAPWPQLAGSTALDVMKGYVTSKATDGVVTFTGAINTGVKSINLTRTVGQTKEGFNLVGNPYPSYVSWMSAIDAANTGTSDLMTTMWYRTKNLATPTAAYVFDTFNETANVGTNNNQSGAVTGMIPPMQAFWVRVADTKTTGKLEFNNSMRSHQDVSTNKFRAPNAQQLLRLQVSNGVNSDEAIVLFNSAASNGFDNFDSPKMTNGSAGIPEIYTTVNNEQLAINGLTVIDANSELPLGFSTGQANSFTLKASEIRNFDTTVKIILKDKLLNTEQELASGNTYSFTSEATTTTDRFSIIFKSASITTDNNDSGIDNVSIFRNKNNQINIDYTGEISINATVSIYSALGQKILAKNLKNASTTIERTLGAGVYLVTVNNAGKVTTKRIILN